MDLNARTRDILTKHGVDINNLGDAPPPDVTAIMVDNANRSLDAGVPAEFRQARITDPQVEQWVHTFLADPTSTPPLMLVGPVGSMKTTNAVAALKECVLSRAQARKPLTWLFTSHPRLNASLRPAERDAHLVAYDAAEKCELLVLDDLGTGLASDWTGDTLYRIVDARWSNHLPTVFTSNLTSDLMRQKVGDRVVSRASSGVVVALKNPDMRSPGARP